MNTEQKHARDKEIETPAACVNPPGNHNDPMAISYWPVANLQHAPDDPRRYSKRDLKKAEGIVRKFGVRLPLIISSDGRVLAGELLLAAAKKLDLEELPVILADDLPPAEQKAMSLALNRFYELGKFDQQLLGSLMLELDVEIPDLELDWIGLDQSEVDLAIACLDQNAENEKAIKVGAGSAVTKLGDIWHLDKHRIGCGDAANAEFYAALLEGREAAMVFADPPYGCNISGFVTGRDHREFVQGSGEQSDDELAGYFESWFRPYLAHTKPGALIYLCIDWRSLDLLLHSAQPLFGKLLNLLVWSKDRAGMGSLYRSQHELIALFKNPGREHLNNVELGRHGRNRSNVWHYPSAMSFAQSGVEGDLLEDHPTPKPQSMIADAILDCTKRGDIVLDNFLGSGSTLIAAEKTGRLCCGMDLDPLYVDLTVRRWQAWTGKEAVLGSSGESFDKIAQQMIVTSDGEADHVG